MTEKKERNAAGRALFQIEFMMLMLNVGRTAEADAALQNALELLKQLEAEIDQSGGIDG